MGFGERAPKAPIWKETRMALHFLSVSHMQGIFHITLDIVYIQIAI